MIKIRGVLLAALGLALVLRSLAAFGVIDFSIPFGVTTFGLPDLLAIAALVAFARHERFSLSNSGKVAATLLIGTVAFLTGLFAIKLGVTEAVSVLVVGISEEIIYRLAAVLLVALGLTKLGVSWRASFASGVAGSTVLFVMMPGHVLQFETLFSPLVFIAFALLMCRVVWRGGALWPAILVHAGIDLVTIMANIGEAPQLLRLGATAIMLLALAPIIDSLAQTRPADREGAPDGLADIPGGGEPVIDLRETKPAAASVTS